MKTYLAILRLAFLPVISIFLCYHASAQVNLSYRGTPIVSGTPGQVGTKYYWPDIGTVNGVTVASAIRIMKINGGAVLQSIDGNAYGYDEAWQPIINGPSTPDGSCWGIEFQISFFDAATSAPLDLNTLRVAGVDIDGDNWYLREYNSFQTPNTYTLESNTLLTTTKDAQYVTFTSGRYDRAGIDMNNSTIETILTYFSTNSFKVVLGSCCSGDICFATGLSRMHSIYFGDPIPFTDPVLTVLHTGGGALPVTITSFSATSKGGVVTLNWHTADESNMAYYVVEQSCTGQSFDAVNRIPVTNQDKTSNDYHSDVSLSCKPAYFRLKCIDQNGKISYSRILRLTDNNTPDQAMQLYYNNGYLHISVPGGQPQQAVVSIFDGNGRGIYWKQIPLNAGGNLVYIGNTNSLMNGIYMAQVMTATAVTTIKILPNP